MEIVYNKETFLNRVYNKSKSQKSKDSAKLSLEMFEKFCISRFSRSTNEVIGSIVKGKLDVYRVLDDFSSYMQSEKLASTVIHMRMAWVKNYLSYMYVEIKPYQFKALVSLPTIEIHDDAELSRQDVITVLRKMPDVMKLFCLLVMTTLRRPKEIVQLRVRDFDFNSKPTMLRVPASLSKNRKEGITFTTNECTEMLREHIRSHKLAPDDCIFTTWAKHKNPVTSADNYFAYHLKSKLPDMAQTIEGLKVKVLKVHIYSFKDFGYTKAEKMHNTNYANGLKGDKKSPYHKLTLEEKREMYLKLEPELTVFTDIRNTPEANLEAKNELADVKQKVKDFLIKQKQDLSSIEERTNTIKEDVNSTFDKLRESMKATMDQLAQDMRSDIRRELDTNKLELASIKKEVLELKKDVKAGRT